LNPLCWKDCLYLDVYSPAIAAADWGTGDKQDTIQGTATYPSGYPVVVWIHGGFFLTGSKNYTDFCPMVNMSLSLNLPTVVVAINYRLGPLGFAAFGDETSEAQGNYGLADQILSLQWVKVGPKPVELM
jgi:carboxylesterase type B